MDWCAVDWGTVPDWIAAIGTTGALLVAVTLLWREQRDHDVAQARLVSAWVNEVDDSRPEPLSGVVVQNKSDEPVYDVIIFLFDSVAHAEVGEPGQEIFHVEVLPPGTRHRATDSVHARMGHIPLLTLTFTDSSNRRWTRKGGSLQRAASDYPYR